MSKNNKTIGQKIERVANDLLRNPLTAEFIAAGVLARVCGVKDGGTVWKDVLSGKLSCELAVENKMRGPDFVGK